MTDQAGAHTPGPWICDKLEGCGTWVRSAIPGKAYTALACGASDEEANANARLIASAPAMAEELERLKKAGADYDREVTQILGRALGYPKYCDDPENFPDAIEADGVCVGEHVAVTLAQDVAEELTRLRAQAEQIAAKDAEIERLIDQRDAAEGALSQAYFLVIGRSPEWSNVFGYSEALEEIDDAQHTFCAALTPQPKDHSHG